MKKIFNLSLFLLFCFGPLQAAVVNGNCGENLTWSLNTKDSSLTIEGSGAMTDYASYYEDYAPWYAYRSYIKTLSLPSGLTHIGDIAFLQCDNLVSVYIPATLTSIGSESFSGGFSNIKEVHFNGSIADWCSKSWETNDVAYKYDLYFGHTKATNINIPDEITRISGSTFSSCYSLTSVTIPNSVTNIDGFAFGLCKNLTNVSIGNNVATIGDYAFYQCENLISIEIPDSVTSIGQWAFFGCEKLTSVTLGSSITEIGDRAFSCRFEETDEKIGSLYSITCKAEVPPTINSTAFDDKSVFLFVPATSIEAYQNAVVWEDFTNIFPIGTNVGTYRVEFRDWNNELLKVDSVKYGSAATAPDDLYREGYTFIGWDVDFNSVKEDLIVTAQYELGENEIFQISFSDMDHNTIIQNEVLLKVPAAPEIEGFTFLGWRPAANIIEYNYIEIEAVYQADGQSAAPEVFTNPANKAQKLIREGNVYILHEGKSYSVQGLEVK